MSWGCRVKQCLTSDWTNFIVGPVFTLLLQHKVVTVKSVASTCRFPVWVKFSVHKVRGSVQGRNWVKIIKTERKEGSHTLPLCAFYECVSPFCLHVKSSLIRSCRGSWQTGTFHLNLSCHTQGRGEFIYGCTQVGSLYEALTQSSESDSRLQRRTRRKARVYYTLQHTEYVPALTQRL